MSGGEELAATIFQLIHANLDLLSSLFQLLLKESVRADDLWNVFYHASSFGYWFLKPFVGEGGGFDIASKNVTAMRHFANMTNYIGANAELIFGNETGQRGLSLVMKNVSARIDDELALKLWNTAREGLDVLMKLLENVNSILR